MTGFKHLALLALGSTQAWTVSAEPVKRQDATAKYCPGGTPICFSEYVVAAQNIIYRIAIPDVQSAPFDILLQIVAPKTVGWAGIAWGGQMSNNPLTLGWPNGNNVVVSSRWTSGKSLPGAYAGAKYTTLPTSTSNSTHWQLDVLCQGCSQWQGGALNPNGQNAFAWAKANRAVSTPSSNTSSFSAHDAKAIFAHDLSQAKIPQGVFDAVAYDLENPTPAAPSSAAEVVPSVQTSVVTLPRPSASAVSSAVVNPVPTRLTALPDPAVSSSSLSPFQPIPTRLTALPDPDTPKPAITTATRTRVVVTTSVVQLPNPRPSVTTIYVYPSSSSSTRRLSTSTVLVIPTRRPTTTVVTVVQPQPTQWTPPFQGGGGGWGGGGKGKGGGGGWGGGGGRGGGPGRGRRPGEDADEK